MTTEEEVMVVILFYNFNLLCLFAKYLGFVPAMLAKTY